jgi:hypothetical protein
VGAFVVGCWQQTGGGSCAIEQIGRISKNAPLARSKDFFICGDPLHHSNGGAIVMEEIKTIFENNF